jgi:chromate reductase
VQQDLETAQPDPVTPAQLGIERPLQMGGGPHEAEEGSRVRPGGIPETEPADAESRAVILLRFLLHGTKDRRSRMLAQAYESCMLMHISSAEEEATMRILIISGSARRESLNTRLAEVAAAARPADAVTLVNDLDRLPFYNGDVEAAGVPTPVLELREAVAGADALVIATPEYNGTVPGMLGNAVDWLSRPAGESVLQGKPVVVLSASPSRYGGIRAAEHLRTVLGNVGAAVAPVGVSVPRAHQRLAGSAADPELATEVSRVLAKALDHAETPAPGAVAMVA